MSLDLMALAAANMITPHLGWNLGHLIEEGHKVERCIRDDLTLKDAADNLKGAMEKALSKTCGKSLPNLTTHFKGTVI
jgi:hypothetical protein